MAGLELASQSLDSTHRCSHLTDRPTRPPTWVCRTSPLASSPRACHHRPCILPLGHIPCSEVDYGLLISPHQLLYPKEIGSLAKQEKVNKEARRGDATPHRQRKPVRKEILEKAGLELASHNLDRVIFWLMAAGPFCGLLRATKESPEAQSAA